MKKDPSSQSLLRMTKAGIITAAHGVRGQIKIKAFIDDIFSYELLDASGNALCISPASKSALIASVQGIHDRNQAESLKGTTLFVITDALPEKYQLTGFDARLANGARYGKIVAVHNFGAGDIIEIGLESGKTEMLPLNENFVQVKDGHVVVFPPDYVEAK